MDTAGQNQLQQWLATHGMQPELMAEAAPRPGRKIHSWDQGVYLTPLGLFLRTSVPCTWRLVSWATAGPLESPGGEGMFLLAAPSLGSLGRNLDPTDLGLMSLGLSLGSLRCRRSVVDIRARACC
jgi:hypothetical protein